MENKGRKEKDTGQTVLLLKSSKENDEYIEAVATKCGLESISIPVLDFAFKNLDLVKEALCGLKEYQGLIFTSPRSTEAFSEALKMIDPNVKTDLTSSLLQIRTFVVGKATEMAICKAFRDFGVLNKTCEGSQEGSAEKLANYIVSLECIRKDSRPLLFICGNIARDTLPRTLQASNIKVRSIVAYETLPDPRFRENFVAFIAERGDPMVIVFFSPSGAQFHLSTIKEMVDDFQRIKIVAIGQTTAKIFLEQQYVVHGIAQKPTAESLSKCVKDVWEHK